MAWKPLSMSSANSRLFSQSNIMQSQNLDFPIVVLGRDIKITPALRYYAITHIRRVHREYPKIIDAKVICWQDDHEVGVGLTFRWAGHIQTEALAHGMTVEAGIDLAFEEAERQMWKQKVLRLKVQHERGGDPVSTPARSRVESLSENAGLVA
jgi:putative sigma-54 modulation protein